MESKATIKIEIDDTVIKAVWAKYGDDEYRRIMLLPGDSEALIKLLSNIVLTHTTILKPRRVVIEADMEVDDDKEKN
jgi:hypothetical protein